MGNNFPRPDGKGVVMGDTAPMPNQGTGTGFNGDTYGADVSPEAINRVSGISGATHSHPTETRPGVNNQGK